MNRKTKAVINGTDDKRRERAENCKILYLLKRTPKFIESVQEAIPAAWKRYDYIVSSREKSQSDSHQGYVILDAVGNIREHSCGATNVDGIMELCGDHQYRWKYAMNKNEMSSWDQYPGYVPDVPHTRDPALKNNPSNHLSLCKHCYAVMEKIRSTPASSLIKTEDGLMFPLN
jgi:hypothetical protein